MKKNIIFILLFSISSIHAQINRVMNPRFEQFTTCPEYSDEVRYCTNWMGLDTNWRPPDWAHDLGGVPDLVSECSTSIYTSVPINPYYSFNHQARSGSSMIAFDMFNNYIDSSLESRDYLQGHLSDTLTRGDKYSVAFYVLLMPSGYFAINHIGAYLDDGTIDTTHHPGWTQSQYTPQVYGDEIINDTLNWSKIEGTFIANGTEKFITIGDFFDRFHTDYSSVLDTTGGSSGGGGLWTYYLLDDVSVIDCANMPDAGNDTLIHPGDSTFVGTHEPLIPYVWYEHGSSTPIDSGGGFWVHPLVTTTYIVEQNLCGVIRSDSVVVHVWPDTAFTDTANHHINSVATTQLQQCTVYPNPATYQLNIEGARGCIICIIDVVGKEVFTKVLDKNKENIDISALDPGVYFVNVSDGAGFKVVKKVLKE